MRLNINKKQVSIIQSTNINMNIYVTMLDGSNSCSWCSLKHWRRHSSLIFLVLLFTKPNIELSGWLYQTKMHFTYIVYQSFSRVSPPSFTLNVSHDTHNVGHYRCNVGRNMVFVSYVSIFVYPYPPCT